MKKNDFDRAGDEELSILCAEPIIESYKEVGRRGGDFQSEIFNRLTEGQQALFLYRSYYNHAIKSEDDFYWWTSYFLPQTNLWAGIKKAYRYFGDTDTLQLIAQIEGRLIEKLHPRNLQDVEVSFSGMYTDPELQSLFKQAYAIYRQLAPASLKQVADHIRSHPKKFVIFFS